MFYVILILLHVSWMVVEYLLPQHGGIDMSIYLRCSNVLMTKQRLYDAQVGTTLEQCCGKRVAKSMWRNSLLDTSLLSLPLYHDQYHRAGEVMSTTVQEYVVLLATFYVKIATVGEP